MPIKRVRSLLSLLVSALLATAPDSYAAQNPNNGKYKLAVMEDASTLKRVRKGRVSSQAVVKITDENGVPVPGIAVAFTLPSTASGASFTAGGLTSVVTTNTLGVATSSTFTAASSASFSMSVVASVPGTALTASIPINSAVGALGAGAAAGAGAGAGAGISTGLLVGIIAGVGAAAGIGTAVALRGGSRTPAVTGPPTPSGAIGAAGTITIGAPR